jgi:cobalamin biosynthesis Mg chelatase CobN
MMGAHTALPAICMEEHPMLRRNRVREDDIVVTEVDGVTRIHALRDVLDGRRELASKAARDGLVLITTQSRGAAGATKTRVEPVAIAVVDLVRNSRDESSTRDTKDSRKKRDKSKNKSSNGAKSRKARQSASQQPSSSRAPLFGVVLVAIAVALAVIALLRSRRAEEIDLEQDDVLVTVEVTATDEGEDEDVWTEINGEPRQGTQLS